MDCHPVRKKIDVTETQAYKDIYAERLRLCGFRYAKINPLENVCLIYVVTNLLLEQWLGNLAGQRELERVLDLHLYNWHLNQEVTDSNIGSLGKDYEKARKNVLDRRRKCISDSNLEERLPPNFLRGGMRSSVNDLRSIISSNGFLTLPRDRNNNTLRSCREISPRHRSLTRQKSKSEEHLFRETTPGVDRSRRRRTSVPAIFEENRENTGKLSNTRKLSCLSFRDLSSVSSIFEVSKSTLLEMKGDKGADRNDQETEEGYESITSSQESIQSYSPSEVRIMEARHRLSQRYARLNSLDKEISKAAELISRIKRFSPTPDDENKLIIQNQSF